MNGRYVVLDDFRKLLRRNGQNVKKKVLVSGLESSILQAAMGFRRTGYNEFTVRGMSDFLNHDNAKVVHVILKQMEKKHLVKDEGWHKNNKWYSLTDEGCESCDDMALASEQENELKIVEKTKHIGIPTTTKEKTISPAPKTYEDSSEQNIGGEVVASGTKACGSCSQKDTKKMEFAQGDKS